MFAVENPALNVVLDFYRENADKLESLTVKTDAYATLTNGKVKVDVSEEWIYVDADESDEMVFEEWTMLVSRGGRKDVLSSSSLVELKRELGRIFR